MFWITVFCLFFQLLFASDISSYLKQCSLPEDQIQPLTGGYSGSEHYRIVGQDRILVLKVYPKGYPETNQAKRELATCFQAAEMGLAPKIHWISLDRRAVLMDCVEGPWLSIEAAKNPHNIIAIANALRKVHGLPKSPLTRRSAEARVEELFQILKENYGVSQELELAMQKRRELDRFEMGPKATIHGDLNPRNIFLTSQGVKFIDWSETSWEDPYYDLTCFALLHDLNETEETLLLQAYIGNRVFREEKKRYDLIKKINLIDQAVNLIFLANQLNDNLEDGPIENWSFYTKLFAESAENLSAQTLYDWGRCCLRN